MFVSERFISRGGIESRLARLAEALSGDDVECVLFAYEIECPGLRGGPVVALGRGSHGFGLALALFVSLARPIAVEFQSGGSATLRPSLLRGMRRASKVGYCIHGDYVLAGEVRRVAPDYVVVVSNRLERRYAGELAGLEVRVLEPWFPSDQPVSPRRPSRRALLVSRLDRDKHGGIRNAIELSRELGLSLDVAGEARIDTGGLADLFDDPDLRHVRQIGPVESAELFRRCGAEYCLVFGVGQVVIEAGLAGIPAVVVAHEARGGSRFATRDNFTALADQNWTIKEPELAAGLEVNIERLAASVIAGEPAAELDLVEAMRTRYSGEAAREFYRRWVA